MKVRDLAFVALRILSIYLVFIGLRQIVNVLQFIVPAYYQMTGSGTPHRYVILASGIATLIYFILGAGLWVYANKLSKYIVPAGSGEADPVSADFFRPFEGFVFSIAGLVIVIFSFSTMTKLILNYVNYISIQQVYAYFNFPSAELYFSMAEQLIRLLLGIALLLRAEWLSRMLRKART